MKPIYLDHNATTPIAPQVADAMIPYLKEHFGNPSSLHWYGQQTKRAVEDARQQVAELLGCEIDEIIFTSGGSESNNMAIKGIAASLRRKGNHIITSQIEHPAVLNVCKYLEQHGFEVSYAPVDSQGVVDVNYIASSLKPTTILISIMHANNEVGTIQPIQEIAEYAREHRVIFHTDAAQSAGKIPVKVQQLGVDLLSIAGHKLYAPKGIGALFIRRGLKITKLIHGADHEHDVRAGTENVLEIVGLGKACELAEQNMEQHMKHMQHHRDQLWQGLKRELPTITMNGHPTQRLPNTLSVSFPGLDANTLLSELKEVAASPGAACHTNVTEPSAVLVAMKVPLDKALGTVRFSTGRMNNDERIDEAIRFIVQAVKRLQPDGETERPKPQHNEIRLTQFTHGLGCACKLRPQNLEKVLASLPHVPHPNVLVGIDTSDDAAVYKINGKKALVQTVDFFTPVVDDAYHFGAIAAANSLSDIYAMGAKPLFALNIVGFPEKRLPIEVLERILQGAHDKAREAGIPIIGGHTVEDSEPKFGLTVTGMVETDQLLTNRGARPGDALILTKPIGLGILSTAIKRGLVDTADIDSVIELMSTLNRSAAEAMQEIGVHSCTDVTGFGLLGHLKEMTVASGVDARISLRHVPLIAKAWELANANVIPGGSIANKDYVSPWVEWDVTISEIGKMILCDAQTSGGLLIAVEKSKKDSLIAALEARNVPAAAYIGEITGPGKGIIKVMP
ncbi:selenide, water dikinase SelD [candidate division KSB1 bacterium]|nr:selenide, water dikinase SelD [candidate division KSB1 bacterium]